MSVMGLGSWCVEELSTREFLARGGASGDGEEGALPMHVVPKVLSICSGGMESVGVDWMS